MQCLSNYKLYNDYNQMMLILIFIPMIYLNHLQITFKKEKLNYSYFSALSKREFLGFNSNTNNRSRNSKKSSSKGYKYSENNISGPGGNLIVSTDYINQGSGGENEISMPVKLNALRYGGYSAECILDRVEPNGNIPEKEIAGQYT